MSERWTPADLPALSGVTAVVTGANSGLGLETAVELARAGTHVVLACRDPLRGDEALGQVRVRAPGSSAELRPLDLASLASVRAFADAVLDRHPALGLLVNNAGVMAVPRRTTADGFELQLGTNHLGHFALTGLLLPALLAAGGSGPAAGPGGGPARVVTVASNVHKMGRLHRDDLMGERRYSPWGAYAQAKLANLLFVRELAARAAAASAPLLSLASHPGYARTNLTASGPAAGSTVALRAMTFVERFAAQSANAGAWPSLRAAGDPGAANGDYFGPGGFLEQKGHPRRVQPSAAARDDGDARWLWDRSVELTGVEPKL